MSTRYRMRAVPEVDAIRVFDPAADDLRRFLRDSPWGLRVAEPRSTEVVVVVHAHDRELLATRGDWIVRDTDGTLHVVTHAEFVHEYEPIPENRG